MKGFRQTLLLLLLAALLLWPAVQNVMVRRAWFDATAFGAWGDHAAPKPAPLLILHLVDRGDRERVLLSETPQSVQAAGRKFLRRRSALGQREIPLELARALLLAYDEPSAVEIAVVEDRLESSSAHIERREKNYRYERGELF